MTRRTKLALIILAAIILLGLAMWFFLQPFFANKPAAQPPALPATATPALPKGPTNTNTAGAASSTAYVPPEAPSLIALEQQAQAFVERLGSGTSQDGFSNYNDVILQADSTERLSLLNEQAGMQKQHPKTGATYGLTFRAVSSHVTKGVANDPSIQVTVTGVQSVDAGDLAHPVSQMGKKVVVTFVKQADNSYDVDAVSWTDVAI